MSVRKREHQNDLSDSEKAGGNSGSSNKRAKTGTISDWFGQSKASKDSLPQAPLTELLDLSSLNDESVILERFQQIAKALLHEHHLVVRRGEVTTVFEILEVEFYLQKTGSHEDPFTHGSEEQRVSGRWYFHRAPRFSQNSHRSATSLTEYRDGTRKGMDLTIGQKFTRVDSESVMDTNQNLLRGGVLFRTIRGTAPNSKVVSGPSLLVDQILQSSGVSSISDLVENHWVKDTLAFDPPEGEKTVDTNEKSTSMALVLRSSQKSLPKIYNSPRIGLELSHPGITMPTATSRRHPRIVYVAKPYRFFVHPELLTKTGRHQTFFGVLKSCASTYPNLDAALSNSRLLAEIIRITDLKKNVASNYLSIYKTGKTGGLDTLKSYIGSQGKGASSSPGSYLKMMGAIDGIAAT